MTTQQRLLAVGIGTLISSVFLFALAASANGDGNHEHHGGVFDSHHTYASDERLKNDVQFLKTLDNGVRVYTFRYNGTAGHFGGVIAQDILKDARFSHAVRMTEHGFYEVDYHALGLGIENPHLMKAAGDQALALAIRPSAEEPAIPSAAN